MAKKKFIGQIHEFNRYAEGSIKEAIKLDLIDRKLLYLLGENARISNTFLANKLNLKKETVSYRIKRMGEGEFLHGYMTLINHKLLGLRNYMVYIKLKTITHEAELLNCLHAFEEVIRLKNCSGSYDIQIVFSVRSEEEFLEVFEKITDQYNNHIQSYDLFEIIDERFLGLGILLDENERNTLIANEKKGSSFQKEFEDGATQSMGAFKFDEKDLEILNILKLDGKIPIVELSSRVSLAPIAVENRVKKMISAGVIKAFIPLTSLSHIGYQWFNVFFQTKNMDEKKFLTYLKMNSNVLWCIKTLGKWKYHFSIFAKDNIEFHKVIDEIRTIFAENIISYDSVIVFNQLKYVQRVE